MFKQCIKYCLIGAAIITAVVFATMYLWNWLMPSIFNIREITLLETIGLLVLSKILFGSFRGKRCCHGNKHGWWKERMRRKFEKMSPEEREKYKAKMAKCCGFREENFDSNADASKE